MLRDKENFPFFLYKFKKEEIGGAVLAVVFRWENRKFFFIIHKYGTGILYGSSTPINEYKLGTCIHIFSFIS